MCTGMRSVFRGIGPGLSGSKGTLTDTRVRYTPKGSLALYTVGGYEALGLIYGKCSGLATNLRPWIICGRCGKPLLEVVSPALPLRTLQADWVRNVAVPAGGNLESPPAITQLIREAAPLISAAAPGPSTSVLYWGHGHAHLHSLMAEPP